MKWLIVLVFIVILGALASAGMMMLRRKPGDAELDKRMARALAALEGHNELQVSHLRRVAPSALRHRG